MRSSMKKSFFLTLILSLFLLGFNNSNAQIKFGAKAGLNISNVSGDDAGSPDSKVGLVLGGLIQYQFAKMFGLQPELLFSMKGASEEGGGVKSDLSLNYIELPILVKFLIPLEGNKSLVPSLYAGPSIGYNVSADLEQTANNQSQSTDISDDVETLDFGLAFGGGIEFPIGNNNLGFDVRYTLGLSSWDNSGADADVKNTAISLNATFVFNK